MEVLDHVHTVRLTRGSRPRGLISKSILNLADCIFRLRIVQPIRDQKTVSRPSLSAHDASAYRGEGSRVRAVAFDSLAADHFSGLCPSTVGRYRHLSAAADPHIQPPTNVRDSTWNERRAIWINRILGIDVGIVPGGGLSRFTPCGIGPGVLSARFLARGVLFTFPCSGSMAR